MKKLVMVVLGLMCAVGMAGMVMAGSIEPPGAPGSSASKMPAVGAIYTYLTTGTPAPTPGTSFTEPSSSPAVTGHTVAEVYAAVATPFPRCDAAVSDVRSGKKFFCTAGGSWGLQTGTYAPQVYCTLLKTGQTSVYREGDDGSKTKGKAFNYSNSTSGNSVLDNVTGLMWAKSGSGAGCDSGAAIGWTSAIDWAIKLTFDGYYDWRLPNNTELQSILVRDASLSAPYINKTYFTNTISGVYWNSTTSPVGTTSFGMAVGFDGSYTTMATKNTAYRVRAVRGGE